MGYRTVDEWENFEFQDADVGQIHMEKDRKSVVWERV